MSEKFKIKWEAYDGYAGGSAPQSFSVDSAEIEDDMTDDDLADLYERLLQEDFQQKVSANGCNRDEFIAWAKEQIANRE